MWKSKQTLHSYRPNNTRSRPIKSVPKKELLQAIAQSKLNTDNRIIEQKDHTILHTFNEFQLNHILKENIKIKGYIIPTPIQDQAIPQILDNRDVIGIANTGTGKTAAFMIPLLQKIIHDKAQRVLIIVPTRELAYQIFYEARELSRNASVRYAIITGGSSEWRQLEDIKRDPHIIIATPGRLRDFIESRKIRLSGFRNIVLDEADRMVDFGFINDITYFISLFPKDRQSLFFSATISGRVSEILETFVKNPIKIIVKSENSTSLITQEIIYVSQSSSKEDMLHEMLLKKEFEKVLVFGRTKHGVQRLSDKFNKRGISSGAIHGNKRQNQRIFVLNQFMRNEIQTLFATDVASRGLDIPDVSHVINYDLPETMDDYIHRIGRTGRASKKGIAMTFIE